MVKCLTITSYMIIISCDVFLYHAHTFEVRIHFKRLTSHNDSMYKTETIRISDKNFARQ